MGLFQDMKITGSTPLISIDDDGRIWAKLETHNRTGSVKDRMIEYILDRAVAENNVEPGVTQIVEATSGNTGINESGAFSPMQFSNPLNVECHRKETALEIHKDIIINNVGKWVAFVHGAGTGGTMMGVKQYIDDKNLDVKCILTQPSEDNATHGIQGINDGADFLLDRKLMDETISIKTDDAIDRMKKFWKERGILVGISSGANILAAEKYVEKHDPSGIVITILCDRGERYL
jgi:cysteine synthase